LVLALAAGLFATGAAQAQTCQRSLTANVVAFDQPLMYNRLGAQNINGMMFALQRDVIPKGATEVGGALTAGNVELRPDKRPRPLVLRVRVGDCLTVNLTNLLAPAPNPNKTAQPDGTPPFNLIVDGQVKSRKVGFNVSGLQLVNSIADSSSHVGANASSLVDVGATRSYTLYAEKEGVFLVQSSAATIGGDANQGNTGNGLFGQVIVEPRDARIYRSILTEEEMRLAADANLNGVLDAEEKTATGQPKINYEATYPGAPGDGSVWAREGKAGLPIINTISASNEIVHSELEAMIVGPCSDGSWNCKFGTAEAPYPLERQGKRNPTVPNRLEAFRDFAQVWHDEPNASQAFPGFYEDPVFKYVLAGVKDGFMINFGSGGIGSEIIANRLGVGPMHDCLSCSYEEFFLTSFSVGDPALLVDVPANVGLELCTPADAAALVASVAAGNGIPAGNPCAALGPKAAAALYPADPINVHHSYIGDFVKFRNTHVGKEQHVFHLHNHQWLYNPNDDNSNYLDAQGLGPGIGYTYEINFGGSGNRNKSAGDAIFHCHFYPHFAQGMWYHWRHYDTFEAGTRLTASATPSGYHTTPFELRIGVPAPGARAVPDGEVAVGVPIAAIVPLPGKPMAPLPGEVTVAANPLTKPHGLTGAPVPVGSVAKVIDRTKNPGYPFWVAGVDAGPNFDGTPETNMSVVGQRPPSPVLDMLNPAQATALKADPLFDKLVPAQADGWDGGLPRHALRGYAAGGKLETMAVTARDFTKVIAAAEPVFFPEGGTDVERLAMAFHKVGKHPTTALKPDGSEVANVSFITNGVGPVVGAPYHEPCRDDRHGEAAGHLSAGTLGQFFGGAGPGDLSTTGRSNFNATSPRIYKGVNIQFDAILNKVGYHYPQQRIITLWEDAVPVILKQQPPEPLVMRLSTFDCAVFSHTNLVPEYFEMDDYQVRTPTDIIGQHIHLPKWDLTTTDGAANGWNYEDGTFSPGAVRERIHAINEANLERLCHGKPAIVPDGFAQLGYAQPRTVNVQHTCPGTTTTVTVPELQPLAHPFFGTRTPAQIGGIWMGARTTMQRWFADPVVNTDGVDRGLGIIFTHDHYGPSTHQQIGLYATVLTQPAGSTWRHNETGVQLGAGPNGTGGRMDGGPTSWQAAILPPTTAPAGVSTQPHTVAAHREFYFEFSDFQHAYEKGAYVGANEWGVPIAPGAPFLDPGIGVPDLNPRINRVAGVTGGLTESFRVAINPPARQQINPLYPDLVVEVAGGQIPGCPARPCPQAIDVQDPGVMVVNYRNEPVALRVFDPNKTGPDGKRGMQADGIAGDLSFALASQLMDKNGVVTPITRVIPALNQTEQQLGFWARTLNAPTATLGGDPFTPMMRAYAGDIVRVKIQAGGHEEEHNATVLGLKWLQAGSGFGKAPNSGWRNSQAAGISEQFTLSIPMNAPVKTVKGTRDYVYNIDSSMDGWWSGTWGLLRTYDELRTDLVTLPNNTSVKPDRIANKTSFTGVCPTSAPANNIDVIAILANHLLPNPAGVTIVPGGAAGTHVGGALNANGGTLVYNPRATQIPVANINLDGETITVGGHAGPLHDPTAMLYVDARDVEPVNPNLGACKNSNGQIGVGNAACPIRLKAGRKVEPLVIRANANDCVNLTVYNRLPALAPDLPTLATLMGVVKRTRNDVQGAVPFDNNLIRPSSHVGIVPQLVAVDVMSFLGLNVGVNVTQTVPPVDATGKSGKGTYTWYAGDLSWSPATSTSVTMTATPVEFGGVGLSPADKIKQGQKSLVGGMVIAPQGANVAVDANTRTQATVTRSDGSKFRDFVLVLQKDTNQRYADGAAVEHINGEGMGIPEDSQESSGMALNYGIEPLWFRFGIAPNAPFGGAGCGPGCYGGVDADLAYANSLAGGDPVTPVFRVRPGTEARVHSVVPHGTSRGSTLTFYGHVWQRDPYVCPGEARNGLTGACTMTSVASRAIGDNPMGFAQGAQESVTPLSHFTYRFPKAGGVNGVTGDYLFRDTGSFGNAAGLWGLLRVDPGAPQ
jgi:hypothetical protein